MSRRRFLLLGATLVALNAFFWLAQGGLALPAGVIDRLFGPKLIRAEVVVGGPAAGIEDFRIDRGVITSTAAGSITLRERDGTSVTIPVTPATRVTGPARFADVTRLRPPLRVLVIRKLNGPAQQIQVERPLR